MSTTSIGITLLFFYFFNISSFADIPTNKTELKARNASERHISKVVEYNFSEIRPDAEILHEIQLFSEKWETVAYLENEKELASILKAHLKELQSNSAVSEEDFWNDLGFIQSHLMNSKTENADLIAVLGLIQVERLIASTASEPTESLNRIKELLQFYQFSVASRIGKKFEALTYKRLGQWVFANLDQPNYVVDCMSRFLAIYRAIEVPLDYPSEIPFFITLTEALLDNNQLLPAEYLSRLLVYKLEEIGKTEGIDLAYLKLAKLYSLQSNPDSVSYYANKAKENSSSNKSKLLAQIHLHKIDRRSELNANSLLRMAKTGATLKERAEALYELQQINKSRENTREFVRKLEFVKDINEELARSYRAKDVELSTRFALQIVSFIEKNGELKVLKIVEDLLEFIVPKMDQVASNKEWTFSEFQALNHLNKATLILVKQGVNLIDPNKILEWNQLAIKHYYELRSNQLLLENLLFLGHNISDIFRVSSELYYELSLLNPNQIERKKLLQQSFVYADMNRAQLQLEMLLVNNNMISNEVSIQERQQYYQIYFESEQLIKSFYQKPKLDDLESLLNLSVKMLGKKSEFQNSYQKWDRLWKNPDQYFRQIQEGLAVDECILLYNLMDDIGRVFIVSNNSIHVQTLRFSEGLSEKIDDFQNALIDQKDEKSFVELNEYVSSIIIEPIEPFLKKRIYLITDTDIERLPYNMLLLQDNHYLVDKFIISKALNARILMNKRMVDQEADNRVSLVIPVEFTDPMNNKGFSSLPFSILEAKNVTQIVEEKNSWWPWSDRYETLSLEQDQAIRSKVVDETVLNSSILHFATHSYTDYSNFNNTRILLNGASGLENSFLKLRDIYNLPLRANLVVLNGCETGSGKTIEGEGTIGLTHAFLVAGSKTILSSFWPVEDRASARFMEIFYQTLFEEDTPLEADYAYVLNKSIKRYRKMTEFSSPSNWATFYTIGW